jgi:hypothetical protein
MLIKVLNKVQKVLNKIGEIFTATEAVNKDAVATDGLGQASANDLPNDSVKNGESNLSDIEILPQNNSTNNGTVQVNYQSNEKVIVKNLSDVENYIEKFAKQNADFSDISKEKLYEFADNVELTEFFSKLSDERLKELLSKLNTEANNKVWSKAQNFTPSEEAPNNEASSSCSENQEVNLQGVDLDTLRDMFKQYAFHNVMQGLNDKEKFSELEEHLNDATLYIPNYINKGYQTDIKGRDISGDNYPLQIED